MILTAVHNLGDTRRQRWVFTLAPVDHDSDSIALVLAEYAMEHRTLAGGWVRPLDAWYKRRGGSPARLPLANVPAMSAEARLLVREQLWRHTALVAQSDAGVQTL